MSIAIQFTGVCGDKNDVHNKQLFIDNSKKEIPDSFWTWRLIRAGKQMSWDADVIFETHTYHLVRPIGHWSNVKSETNPLIYFG